jgi:hypothetical protein
MAFTHSKKSRVLMGDGHMSGHISGYSAGSTLNLSEVTTLPDEGTTHIPGLLDGTISMNGFFDPDEGGLYDRLRATRNVAEGMVTTILPDGLAVGRPAFLTIANATSFAVDASVAEAVTLSVEGQPNGGVDWGVSLHGLTEETETGDALSVDDQAATTRGGVATLHVTATAGASPAVDVLVQHSDDDVVWVDLIAFDQVTEPGHQYRRVSGTVERYLRSRHVLGVDTTSVTYATAFARR